MKAFLRSCIGIAPALFVFVVLLPLSSSGRENGDAFSISEVNRYAYPDMTVDTADAGMPASSPTDVRQESGGFATVILRTIGYLVLITALIVGLLWGMRKLGMTGSSRIGGGSMDLLEVLPVGQNRSILLVRVMDVVLVLAQTAQQISVVERIEGDKAVELIASTKGGTSMVPFKEMFNSFVGRVKKS